MQDDETTQADVQPDDEAQATPEAEQPHGSLEDRVAALESLHEEDLEKLHAQQGGPVSDEEAAPEDSE